MSEEVKKERSSVEIQNEYQLLCAKAGDLQYRASIIQGDLERLNAALRDLNLEHSKSKQKEAEEEAKKVEEVKS